LKDLVSVARIVKSRGVRGEVAADLLTDFPERFEQLHSISIIGPGKHFEESLEEYWFHKNRIILKFAGRDSPEDVRELIGCEVRIPVEDRVDLPADAYYDSELVGCELFQRGRPLGRVTDLLKVGDSVTNLVIVDSEGREFMVPFIHEFIRSVAIEQGRIEAELPPGLLDLAVETSTKKSRSS
jgi:16S rRNA processing protein RimM